jgi:hypothetical protein
MHSELYIEGVSVEDVIRYFNEVVLDSEFSDGGNSKLIQKWANPIVYWVGGTPTDEDLAVLESFMNTVNEISGFPGFVAGDREWLSDLRIYFCDGQEMENRMGSNFANGLFDGAVTFWYDGENRLYSEVICIRYDIDQRIRNSVIQEELYNGLGPVQDTILREDSIIYQYGSDVQSLSAVDLLLLQLLYHPEIQRGMNAEECETVIRQLYY